MPDPTGEFAATEAHVRPMWFGDGTPITIEVQGFESLRDPTVTAVVSQMSAVDVSWVLQVPVCLGVTQGDQIVGVPENCRAARHRLTGMNTGRLVADPSGLLHPVESNIEQQRADHPALRSSLLGRGEPTFLDTPALSQSAISSLAGNVPSRRRRWSWSIRSNAAARSASSTHRRRGFAPRATWKMASIASWQPRPGRKPYDLGRTAPPTRVPVH